MLGQWCSRLRAVSAEPAGSPSRDEEEAETAAAAAAWQEHEERGRTRTAGWVEGQKKPYTGDVGKLEQQNHSWLPTGCPCPISIPGLPSAATKSVAQPGSCSFG